MKLTPAPSPTPDCVACAAFDSVRLLEDIADRCKAAFHSSQGKEDLVIATLQIEDDGMIGVHVNGTTENDLPSFFVEKDDDHEDLTVLLTAVRERRSPGEIPFVLCCACGRRVKTGSFVKQTTRAAKGMN